MVRAKRCWPEWVSIEEVEFKIQLVCSAISDISKRAELVRWGESQVTSLTRPYLFSDVVDKSDLGVEVETCKEYMLYTM